MVRACGQNKHLFRKQRLGLDNGDVKNVAEDGGEAQEVHEDVTAFR